MSGSDRRLSAGMLRLALWGAEPFYAAAARLRNKLYGTGLLPTARLSRPVISIGNLTAGGTGKTPMVRWLAGQLRCRGYTVAILSRGYKSAPGVVGDEQLMLERMLNSGAEPPVILVANPNRVTAAAGALGNCPAISVFLLDDGFQHRRVARDLDIVLISATDPFGHGHVLPRGLLREPISGLRRAGAIVITHADRASEEKLAAIEQVVKRYNHGIPMYRASHAPAGLRSQQASPAHPPDHQIEDLRQRRVFAFCGIGDPQQFDAQLLSLGTGYVGHHWFADHHIYRKNDLDAIRAQARRCQADLLLTTEKDWVKVAALENIADGGPEIWRYDIELKLSGNGQSQLLQQVLAAVGQ